MSKKPKTELEALQEIWYKKIAETPDANGDKFVDIERPQFNTDRDKDRALSVMKYHTKETFEAKADYYLMAYRFLETYQFNSDLILPGGPKGAQDYLKRHKHNPTLDKVIWEYHANGLGSREIAYLLNKTKVVITNSAYINFIVQALRYKMFTTRLEDLEETNGQ